MKTAVSCEAMEHL